jgi:hypothetical protein
MIKVTPEPSFFRMSRIPALILFVLGSVSATAQPLKILFIGNSYTYVNDLPGMLQQLAASFGDSILVDSSTPGGYTLELHSTNATTLSKIYSESWDVVVLQEQSQRPSFDPAQVAVEVYPYAAFLDSLVHDNNPCTETVFYMTWGRKNGDASNCAAYPPVCTYEGMQARLRESYLELGLLNNATVSPVGAAWRYARSYNPAFDLYWPDESHPSEYGTYLAACVFYATLFHQSPVGSGFHSTLPAQDAQWLQDIAHDVAFDSLANWYAHGHIPYAGFVSNVNGLSVQFQPQSLNADSVFWDFGDGNSSALMQPVHMYAQPGNYPVTLTAYSGCSMDTATDTIGVVVSSAGEVATFPHGAYYSDGNLIVGGCDAAAGNLELYDITGHLVRTFRIPAESGTFQIRVPDLPGGIYFLRSGGTAARMYVPAKN